MKAAPKPSDETARIQALQRLNILDTPNEEAFDRITRIAQSLLRVPIALVSLIDADRQWFKSCIGFGGAEGERDLSFCGHAILQDDLFIVPDALRDPRFFDNPYVTGPPNIRFYAGAPIRTQGGHKIGTLCVIDHRPRRLSAEKRARLADLAGLVERELMTRVRALTDPLTGAFNRRILDDLLEDEVERARGVHGDLAIVCFDIDHFKELNDTYGHAAGDAVLARLAAACRHTLRPADTLFRIGGEEFVALLPTASGSTGMEAAERLRQTVAQQRIALDDAPALSVTVSVGVAGLEDAPEPDGKTLLDRADAAMYAAKRAGRNRVCRWTAALAA